MDDLFWMVFCNRKILLLEVWCLFLLKFCSCLKSVFWKVKLVLFVKMGCLVWMVVLVSSRVFVILSFC